MSAAAAFALAYPHSPHSPLSFPSPPPSALRFAPPPLTLALALHLVSLLWALLRSDCGTGLFVIHRLGITSSNCQLSASFTHTHQYTPTHTSAHTHTPAHTHIGARVAGNLLHWRKLLICSFVCLLVLINRKRATAKRGRVRVDGIGQAVKSVVELGRAHLHGEWQLTGRGCRLSGRKALRI